MYDTNRARADNSRSRLGSQRDSGRRHKPTIQIRRSQRLKFASTQIISHIPYIARIHWARFCKRPFGRTKRHHSSMLHNAPGVGNRPKKRAAIECLRTFFEKEAIASGSGEYFDVIDNSKEILGARKKTRKMASKMSKTRFWTSQWGPLGHFWGLWGPQR